VIFDSSDLASIVEKRGSGGDMRPVLLCTVEVCMLEIRDEKRLNVANDLYLARSFLVSKRRMTLKSRCAAHLQAASASIVIFPRGVSKPMQDI
jgi:hypothetical protein